MHLPLVSQIRQLRRGLAAALAACALASAGARPLLACEMRGPAPTPERTARSVEEHAPHHAPAPADSPDAPDAPRTPGCDHLVGCISMVIIAAPELTFGAPLVPDVASPPIRVRHDAPVTTLEPPPPRV